MRGFSHVLTGNMLVTLSQAIQFLLLARALGPLEFGKIAAVASVTAVLMPFSGMGAANVMIMRASREPALLGLYFGNALLNALLTGLLLSIAAVVIITPFLGAKGSILIMIIFCLSELIFSKLIDICWQVFISNERLHWTSIFLTTQSVGKLAAVLLFMTLRDDHAADWVWWALSSNLAVAAWVLFMTIKHSTRPIFNWRLAAREFKEGVPFAIGLSAKGFYTDADKIFLARYGAAESVGTYTVAFRVAQMALVPIRAVSLATQAEYFRAGEAGVAGALRVARRLSRLVIPLSILIGASFFLVAPLITVAAGSQYGESATILKWLCGLPLLLALQSILGDVLISSGHQRIAAFAQTFSALTTCVLCLWLIPRLDWSGAVAASYLSQLILVIMLFAAILRYQGKRRAKSLT